MMQEGGLEGPHRDVTHSVLQRRQKPEEPPSSEPVLEPRGETMRRQNTSSHPAAATFTLQR